MNLVVGVSDMKVSNDPAVTLVTYSLGSCIGVVIYDPVVKVGGLLHFMLPEGSLDPEKARVNPFMFADTGIPSLFKTGYAHGAQKQRLKVAVIGGSQILDQGGYFNIGKRNQLAVRKLFWRNNVLIDFEDVGGATNRTVKLKIGTGELFLKTSGQSEHRVAF